ncbi:penicillin-binding protein 2 [Candidatus Parcubacteria bacterium]|nr:penicillin-binding protein 2 [Candidatus Parcubacteria bacterium]
MKYWRLTLLLCLFFIAAIGIVGRLFYLQVAGHKFYSALALGQQVGFAEVEGARGEVFSENSRESHGAANTGELKSLAINKDNWLVSAVPKKIKDKETAATLLAAAIGQSAESILEKFGKSDSYVIIKKDLTDEQMLAVRDLKVDGIPIDGVSLESSSGVYYPQGGLAAQVIGFFGGNQKGQYGIEGYYDEILRGKQGVQEQKKGLDAIDMTPTADLDGSDIYLTLDYNIQFQAEALLKEAHEKIDIESGQIIVMKPDSGRILALANYPLFDLNNYSKQTNLGIFQNGAIQKLFEPGSVFKPFTMAMALQEKKITPESTFTDTGSVKIGPDTVSNFNHEKYGLQKMSGILEKSINTGAVYLSQLIAHETFANYLDALGFDDKTGVALQGEVGSQNNLLKNGSAFGFATASFGQGIEMTPLQLVRAFSVFANGGKIPKPYIVEKIVHGAEQEVTKPVISGQVISPQTASQVTTMLINVVDRGFGDGAKIPGYYLAGKTGTAEVAFEGKKGYYTDRTIQSFIGFGPALKPEFLILVKLDNPKVPKSALSAVPIFKKLSQYIINYWQIPPDYDVASK